MIDGNEIYSNDDVGVLLHRSSDHSTISNNYIYKNDNAGIALFETSDTKVFGNSVMRNTCESLLPQPPLLLPPIRPQPFPLNPSATGGRSRSLCPL